MKIVVEKGRMMSASCHWVHFVLRNTDIMTKLNRSPLVISMVDDCHFVGRIFGVQVMLEVLGGPEPKESGEVELVADVRMPLALGRTYTVARYRYRPVAKAVTMVDLRLELETVGLPMSIYAGYLRQRIDDYLNRIMTDDERAAMLVQEDDPCLSDFLSEGQLRRVTDYRGRYGVILGEYDADRDFERSTTLPVDKRVWDSELTELTTLYEQFRGRAHKLESELTRIRETGDAVATLLIARRMLEVIVAHVCQRDLKRPRGNDPLAGVIDKVVRAQCVPDYVTTSMSNLNRLSTYGAHPKEFSPRQVREALMALCSIVEWYASYSQDEAGG